MSAATNIVSKLLEDGEEDPKDYIGQKGMWIEFGPEVDDINGLHSGYYCYMHSPPEGPDDPPQGYYHFEGGWDNLEDAAEYFDHECGDSAKIIILDAPNRRAQAVPYVRDTSFNTDPNGPKAGYLDFINRFRHGS